MSSNNDLFFNKFAAFAPAQITAVQLNRIKARPSFENVWILHVLPGFRPRQSPGREDWRSERVAMDNSTTNETAKFVSCAGLRFRKYSAIDPEGNLVEVGFQEKTGLKKTLDDAELHYKDWCAEHGHNIKWTVLQEMWMRDEHSIVLKMKMMMIPTPSRTQKIEHLSQSGFVPGKVMYWGVVDRNVVRYNFGRASFEEERQGTFYFSADLGVLTPNRLTFVNDHPNANSMDYNRRFVMIDENGEHPMNVGDYTNWCRQSARPAQVLTTREWCEEDNQCLYTKYVERPVSLADVSSKQVSDCRDPTMVWSDDEQLFVRGGATQPRMAANRYRFKRAIIEEALSPRRMEWRVKEFGLDE